MGEVDETARVKIDKVRAIENEKARARDDYLCHFCGRNIFAVNRGKGNTLHHKIPKRYGGSEEAKNKITICHVCHQKLEVLIYLVERAKEQWTKTKKSSKK